MVWRLHDVAIGVAGVFASPRGRLLHDWRRFRRRQAARRLPSRSRAARLGLEALEARQLLTGVVINEIHYDPFDRDVPSEFIELHNAGATAADLTDWSFSDGVDFSLAAGTTLDPDDYLVIAQDLDAYNAVYGGGPSEEVVAYEVPAGTSGLQNFGGSLGMDFVVDRPIRVTALGVFDSDGNGLNRTITAQLWSRSDRGTPSNPNDDSGVGILSSEVFTRGGPGTLAGGSRLKSLATPLELEPGAYTMVAFGYGSGELLFNGGAGGTGTTSGGGGAVSFVGRSRYGTAGAFPNTVDVHSHQYAAGTFRFDVTGSPVTFGSAIGPFHGSLSNDGEKVVLRNAAGNIVDAVTYRVGFPWPTAANGEGPSMELLHSGLDNDLGGSWRSSDGTPTPGLENSVRVANAGPQMRQVHHSPAAPTSGQDVHVTVKVTDQDSVSTVTLAYQTVDPGNYIRLSDTAYETRWTTVTMTDDGLGGDTTASDNVYTVVLAGTLQTHRRLIRYRIISTDGLGASATGPYVDDPQPNFAYFVYDGIPAWTGADRPGVTSPVTYGTDVTRSLPAFHLLANEADIVKSQYNSAYNNVRFPATLVVDGSVYDHIEFKNRGQNSTYVSGKNKWKLFFNRGHYFQGHDDDGTPWGTQVKKLNLGTGAVPWAPPLRGLAGLDEALAFQLFNLAGVAAPKTTAFQLRVVDSAVEADPGNQFSGDLWGLYLAFEDPDGRFLDEHELPDGNLFRMQEGGTDIRHKGVGLPGDLSDVNAFVSRSGYNKFNPIQPVSWWRDNVDLEGYYSYRAVVEAVNHSDIRDRQNMLLYFNPETSRWSMLPWDLDLLFEEFDRWGPDGVQNHSTVEQFRKALQHTELNIEFQTRARELQDLLFNQDQGWQAIDEYAQRVAPMTAVDRAMWDYHPRTTSAHRGAYYQPGPVTYPAGNGAAGEVRPAIDPVGFEGMVNLVKQFTVVGGFGGEQLQALHSDASIPATPTITAIGAPTFPADDLLFQTTSFSDPQGSETFSALQWRVGEVTHPGAPAYDPNAALHYEVTPIWESRVLTTFADTIRVPGSAVERGHAYRARVRMQDQTRRWGHWSAPIEFIVTPPAGPLARDLHISEINYNPYPAMPALGEPHVDSDEFEFIELTNSGDGELDLSGVSLVDGVQFDFGGSKVTRLAPGQRVLVVKNQAAFEARYGTGRNIAGEYRAGKLSNKGENIKLVDTQSGTIFELSYADSGQWPTRPDGKGATLELIEPAADSEERAVYSDPENWRSSNEFGGTPGAAGTGPVFDVVVNEVVSHTSGGTLDQVELVNTTDSAIDLQGWHLSDTNDDFFKFTFATSVTLQAGEYLVLDESELGFAFDGEHGGDIWLIQGDPNRTGRPLRFADHHRLDATELNVSLGRVPDSDPTAPGAALFPLTRQTFGTANSGFAVGSVVISEVHYHPAPVPPAEQGNIDEDELEFVEIYNTTSEPHNLGGWKLTQTSGAAFLVPAGTTLSPHGTLVLVGFDPGVELVKTTAFRNVHGIDGSVPLIGPYGGKLNNASETLTLLEPLAPGDSLTGFALVDRVAYDNWLPWPTEPDGTGPSLTRISVSALGNFAASWTAAVPTPGSAVFVLKGDVNNDGQVNGLDIDPFLRSLLGGSYRAAADMNQDGVVNGLDVDPFVISVLESSLTSTVFPL